MVVTTPRADKKIAESRSWSRKAKKGRIAYATVLSVIFNHAKSPGVSPSRAHDADEAKPYNVYRVPYRLLTRQGAVVVGTDRTDKDDLRPGSYVDADLRPGSSIRVIYFLNDAKLTR